VIFLTNKVMLIGLGRVGENALSLLARNPGVISIIAADKREEYSKNIVNSTIVAAGNEGYYPNISFRRVDLNDIKGTSELLKDVTPDVILNVATLMSPWILSKLPPKTHRKVIQAGGLGPFLPLQTVLIYKLMQAVKRAGIITHVVNASYCDIIHHLLGKVGLAPTTGMGNIDTLVTSVKKVVGDELQISMKNIKVFMIAHLSIFGYANEFGVLGAPKPFLKIMVNDKEETDRFNVEELIIQAVRTPGTLIPAVAAKRAASSGVKIVKALLNDAGEFLHAPGPNGLPGGWPVWINAQGVEVVLPKEMSMDKGLRIIEGQHKLAGVEKICEDGTVVFTEKTVKIMSETFGYNHEKMRLSEAEKMAAELISRFEARVSEGVAKTQ